MYLGYRSSCGEDVLIQATVCRTLPKWNFSHGTDTPESGPAERSGDSWHGEVCGIEEDNCYEVLARQRRRASAEEDCGGIAGLALFLIFGFAVTATW